MLNTLIRHRRNQPVAADVAARDPFLSFVDRFFNEVAPLTFQTPERGFVPAMDIVETEDAFVATADLPGLTKDDIEISLDDGVLSVSGERKVESEEGEGKSFRRVERAFGRFQRAFTLPQGVDLEKVQAGFNDGVLTVTLPKLEAVKSRKITIG